MNIRISINYGDILILKKTFILVLFFGYIMFYNNILYNYENKHIML